MKLQKSNHTILLVLEKGEDIVECITTFADDQDLTLHLSAALVHVMTLY